MNSTTLQIYILNALYYVLGDGTIGYRLSTSPEISPEYYLMSKSFFKLPNIAIGDIYQITYNDNDFSSTVWTLIEKSSLLETPPLHIDDLQFCPICNHVVIQDDVLKICINDSCLAKLRTNIHKFLFHSGVNLSFHEKQAIDTLIGTKIMYPHQLFTLIESDFYTLDPNIKMRPGELIEKLKQIYGRISIGTYLLSLNIPGIERDSSKYIDISAVNSKFKTLNSFLDWMTEVQLEADRIHYEVVSAPFMSNSYFNDLYSYFLCRPNLESALMLNDLGIFSK